MSMADLTENYQLKWHSYSTHIHSCVASSINNESFADVSLYTMDGHQMLAHRFVLSACSQYLHQVLKVQQKITTTLPLLIILPPEINYKTLKTLVQYMYSGETTVSKDILDNVLRGGDLLKVKGLWRPKQDKEHHKLQDQVPKKAQEGKRTSTSNSDTSEKIDVTVDENSLGESEKKEQKGKQLEQDTSTADNLQFLVIKEEPIEWSELDEGEMEMLEDGDVFNNEMAIKPEVVLDDESEKDEELYSPLTCELCSETFTLPAEWVRHIQTHTDMLPAKRQRRGKSSDEDSGTFPPLHCDMCQKFFPTPAEWVRHIQSSHTEFELRVSNKTCPVRPVRVNRQLGSSHKICTICNKKFPSHASMLIHKRTHTGEKPYMCEHCLKGFNVKSNLLRHLRTLHDRIINSTDVEYKGEGIEGANSTSSV